MKLDAFQGDGGWSVWDCRRSCEVEGVVWVDDCAAQYAYWEAGKHVNVGGVILGNPEVRQCDRIAIITTSRLVLVDPIDDEEKDLIEVAISRPMPLGVE
jgi:hypothetical protein